MLICGISICALSWKLANEDRRNSMFGDRRGVGNNNNTFQYYYGGNDRCTSQVNEFWSDYIVIGRYGSWCSYECSVLYIFLFLIQVAFFGDQSSSPSITSGALEENVVWNFPTAVVIISTKTIHTIEIPKLRIILLTYIFPISSLFCTKLDKKVNFSANSTATAELVPSNNSKYVTDRNSIDLGDSLNQGKRSSLPMVDSLLESKRNASNDQLNNSYFSNPIQDQPEMGNSTTSSKFDGKYWMNLWLKINRENQYDTRDEFD